VYDGGGGWLGKKKKKKKKKNKSVLRPNARWQAKAAGGRLEGDWGLKGSRRITIARWDCNTAKGLQAGTYALFLVSGVSNFTAPTGGVYRALLALGVTG
jgi:hypothetical protein